MSRINWHWICSINRIITRYYKYDHPQGEQHEISLECCFRSHLNRFIQVEVILLLRPLHCRMANLREAWEPMGHKPAVLFLTCGFSCREGTVKVLAKTSQETPAIKRSSSNSTCFKVTTPRLGKSQCPKDCLKSLLLFVFRTVL